MFKLPLRYEYKHGSEYTQQDVMNDIQDLEQLQECMALPLYIICIMVAIAIAIALYIMI